MLSRSAFRAVRAAAPQRTVARAAVRNYAAAATQDAKPPIAVYGLDGTYASALVRRPSPSAILPVESCHRPCQQTNWLDTMLWTGSGKRLFPSGTDT
jgi:hypothetical protein